MTLRPHRGALAVALLAVLAAGSPSALGSERQERNAAQEPLLEPGLFRTPPAEVRPKIRWWWSGDYDSATLVEELTEIGKAGFSGVEVAFDPEGWAGPEQRKAMGAVLRAADRLDMTVDLTLGHTWPVRAPSVSAENGLAAQELAVGTQDVVGGLPYRGPVPGPKSGERGTLHAVVAGRTLSPGQPAPVAAAGPNLTPSGPSTGPLESRLVDPTSLVVLTKQVGPDGTLTWDPPAGAWTLFGVWERTTAEGAEAVPVMDHFERDATTAVGDYIAASMIGKDNLDALRAVGGSFFEDSLEIDADELFWTEEFTRQFKTRRGYDPTPYLPFMVVSGLHHYPVWDTAPEPDADLPDGAGERVRSDYLKTLTELYTDEHLAGFQDFAERYGMQFRTQAAFGAALDTTRSARELTQAGGLADEESLNAGDPASPTDSNGRFATDHYRSVVGGVHQGGGSEVHSELGAMFFRSWQAGLADYKAIMDKQWAFGVTRPVPHGYANNPDGSAWPGRDRFSGIVSDSWNHEHWPQWERWKELNDYWARGTLVLQHGRPQTDVAVYRDGFVTSAATFAALGTDAVDHQVLPTLPGYDTLNPRGDDVAGQQRAKPKAFFDGEGLERQGWTFQYLDPAGLSEPSAVGRGVLYPEGPRYRGVVVDERALPGEAASALLAAARRGVKVVLVGELPSRGLSLAAPAAEDARVRTAMAALVRLPGVTRVADQAAVPGALQRLGLRPAAEWSAPSTVHVNHRVGDGVDYFYLWNGGEQPVSLEASLAASGTPYRMDLASGRITREGEYRRLGSRTVVPVSLTPGETLVLAVQRGEHKQLHARSSDAERVVGTGGRSVQLRDAGSGVRTTVLSDGTTQRTTLGTLPKPIDATFAWQLKATTVGPEGETERDLLLPGLRDWRELVELRRASGTGTYTREIDVPESWLTDERGVRLDLGVVEGAFTVSLNGRRVVADPVTDRPYADQPARQAERSLDVTGLLRPGRNTLVVEVSTTLKNKVVGLTESGSPVGLGAVQPATQPYGLLGPVRLVPEHRVTLTTGSGSAAATAVAEREGGQPVVALESLPATGVSSAVPSGLASAAALAGLLVVRRRRASQHTPS